LWEVFSLLFSKINFLEGLFGVAGRQTGFLTYVSFASLIVISSISATTNFLTQVTRLLIVCGTASALYGLIQMFNLDPFNWTNPYSPVFGIFGNPNFHASFMGISATAATVKVLQASKMGMRVFHFLFIVIAVLNIYKSGSQQGYLVLLSGLIVVFFLYFKFKFKSITFSLIYIFISFIGLLAVLLDILQRSPWRSFLYKD
jgi:hypothetical protein